MCQHPRGLLPRAPQALQVFFTSSRVPMFPFKAQVALFGSTGHINSYCARVQTFGDGFSSRHHRSATAIVMLPASKPCNAISCVTIALQEL